MFIWKAELQKKKATGEKERERHRERESSILPCTVNSGSFSKFHNYQVARARPGQVQETGTPSECSMWSHRSKSIGPSSFAFTGALAGGWSGSVVAGTETDACQGYWLNPLHLNTDCQWYTTKKHTIIGCLKKCFLSLLHKMSWSTCAHSIEKNK